MAQLFKQLVAVFHLPSLSNDVFQQLTSILQQQTDESIPKFVSEKYQWLNQLEYKIWNILIWNSHEWLHQANSWEFFQTLAAFNKKIIFNQEQIKEEVKMALLIPPTTEQFNQLFRHIEQSTDDNDRLIAISNLWFGNLAYLLHEYPRFSHLPLIIQIDDYLGNHYILNEHFKTYLIELQQPLTNFTEKQMFYLKIVPLFLNAYFYSNPSSSSYTPEVVLEYIGEDYLKMIQIQSTMIESWNKDLLSCVTHLIGFLRSFLWWDGENGVKLKLLFTTEKVVCDYVQALLRFISYQPFYQSLSKQWCNDETILLDSALLFMMNIVQTQNIHWYFRSITELPKVLSHLSDIDAYFRIYLCAYGILSEVLTDEHLKELKFTGGMRTFLFSMLEEAWRSPSRRYKQIPILYFLRGCMNMSKNDFVQQATAKLNKIFLFVEMCDEYPLVYDIIWGLSFNSEIQQQLRTSSSFMSKLTRLAKESDNEQMKKTIQGILWNLEICHKNRPPTEINNGQEFDIMISYSHKDKVLCHQIYEELIKSGYRVWIDFNQMHGNVMDAMAQAIEQSTTVVICMSEEYRKSNYCRAEAQYAFQQQRKIVPVLLQKHYKPDGWLLFLLGRLLYIDFNKYEFNHAMGMLYKELNVDASQESSATPAVPSIVIVSPPKVGRSTTSFQSILDWTQEEVKEWLLKNNLVQMSRLLSDCDGRSVIYLYKYMKNCQPQQVLNLLQEDAIQRTKQTISLIEISCFQSLIDQLKHSSRSTDSKTKVQTADS